MNSDNVKLTNGPRRTLGFTLVEAVISVVLVGVMLVAAINMLGATAVSKRSTEQQALGYALAQDLMNEILIQPYEDPTQTVVFGPEIGESKVVRADFDDVDDYENWSATPPEEKNGTQLIGYDQWTRSVDISFVKPTDLQTEILSRTGVKRITVTVARDGIPATQLIALRTQAWPMSRKNPGVDVLFVVNGTENLTSQEKAKKLLMESWGFKVIIIRDADSQENFDAEVTGANVAYISEDINDADLNTKLRYTLIGVVSEEANLGAEFGFAGLWIGGNSTELRIVDNLHYITSVLSLGDLQILSSSQPGHMLDAPVAPGLKVLGRSRDPNENGYLHSLAVIEAGDELYGGELAAGRRARLPWGRLDFDIGELNKSGRYIMRRTIEWAASKEQP